jgi:hypothetical protein
MYLLRRAVSLLRVAALLLILTSCAGGKVPLAKNANTLNAERPKDEACRTELRRELSTLNVGVEASAGELAAMLNRMIPKELYKGSTKTKGLTADLLRTGPVAVSASDNFIHLTIPISLSLSYGMFETPAVATRLKFKVNARVTPDWKVLAEAYYMGLTDGLADNVGIGPISIKPRSIVEGITQPVQRILSDLISRKLNEQFPLKTQVAKAWNAAQKPVLLDKNYNAWLTITPQEVLLYPLYAQKDLVKLNVGLKSYAELVVGPQPPVRQPVPLPNLKLVSGADRTFRVALNTDLHYKDIRAIAQPLLINRELGSDGRKVMLKDLDLYGNGDRLMVKVVTTGDLEGTFYLTCKPSFNAQTNVFSVEDVDFEMQTKSLLLSSADWFLHGTIRNTIQEKLNMDLTQRVTQAREMAGKAMAKVNLAENIFLNGSVKALRLNDVMVQKDRLSIQVYAEGETAVVFH